MIELLAGDARDVLPTLAADSVQCVVTSPPYYGLRDYGTALWDGGDAACDHSMAISEGDPVPPSCRQCRKCGRLSRTRWLTASTVRSECDQCDITTDYSDVDSRGTWVGVKRDADGDWALPPRRLPGRLCRCGATRIDRQIGLEATPDEYLATMVSVFREIRRVLRSDGTCWVNMGDSYASSTGSAGASMQSTLATKPTAAKTTALREQGSWSRNVGTAKPKDLLMMPARLALALQADGWWLRSDIIWHKPNPMPESVTDRPTSAHEHVFLLTKKPRYYFDNEAIRETSVSDHPSGNGYKRWPRLTYFDANGARGNDEQWQVQTHRACRNVWTLATESFSGAHFATFPSALAERCIRAGTSERGACSQCGAPWGRVTDTEFVKLANRLPRRKAVQDGADMADINSHNAMGYNNVTTTGWSPSCRCGTTETRPCVVLDPFAGASTSLLVAQRLQRDAIGIELNPDYVKMGRQRIEDEAGLFADVQTLDGAPVGDLPETEDPGSPERRSAYPDPDDAQPSLWEWDRELAPT